MCKTARHLKKYSTVFALKAQHCLTYHGGSSRIPKIGKNISRDRDREDRRTWRQSRLREGGVRTRSDSSSRSQSNLRVSINRDRVRCFKCREYDHFANECPNLVIIA